MFRFSLMLNEWVPYDCFDICVTLEKSLNRELVEESAVLQGLPAVFSPALWGSDGFEPPATVFRRLSSFSASFLHAHLVYNALFIETDYADIVILCILSFYFPLADASFDGREQNHLFYSLQQANHVWLVEWWRNQFNQCLVHQASLVSLVSTEKRHKPWNSWCLQRGESWSARIGQG